MQAFSRNVKSPTRSMLSVKRDVSKEKVWFNCLHFKMENLLEGFGYIASIIISIDNE